MTPQDARCQTRVCVDFRCVSGTTLLMLTLTGCVSTLGGSHDSSKADERFPAVAGVPYRLPKVTMGIALVRDDNGVSVVLSEPNYDGDPTATYLLQYHPRSSAKDTFDVSVDPNTGLLTGITGEAEDQGAKIVEELGKLAGALAKPEAALAAPEAQVFYEAVFDPANATQVESVSNVLSAALSNHVRPALRTDCEESIARVLRSAQPFKDQKARDAKDRQLREASAVCKAEKAFRPMSLRLNIDYAAFKFRGATPTSCANGFCTRVLSPALLSVFDATAHVTPLSSGTSAAPAMPSASETTYDPNKFGRSLAARSFSMPNDSDPVPIELSRATFAKVNYEVRLQNGLVSSSKVVKESEALAIVSSPLNALKAFFASIAEFIQLRVDITNKQQALLDAEKEKLQAQQELKDAREALKNPTVRKTESAVGTITNVPFLKVIVPGLGPGSGAELAVTRVQNQSTSLESARQPSTPHSTSLVPNSVNPLGGPVQEGSNGPQK